MPSSRLFRKFFLAFVGVHCAASIIVGLMLTAQLGDGAIEAAVASKWIWTAVALGFVCGLAVIYVLSRRIALTVAALNKAASAIAAGDYERRAYVPGRDELGTLAGTLNRLSESLGQHSTQLDQTASRQATVLSGMVEGVIAVDRRERVVLANAAASRLYGFPPGESEGRPLLEVIRNHELHAAVLKVLDTGEPQRLESPCSATQKFHAEVHAQPLPGQPCPGVVLVIHDTTELQRLAAIRRDFVANVSHELKTPLSSIKAYTETLQNGADADTTKRFLTRIEEQADRLQRLIVDMLMLTRIESTHQAFEIVPIDVADVVRDCLEGRRLSADAKRITLTAQPTTASPDDSLLVRVDREGLREILDNLVDNAIKYTPEGGRVTVTWRKEEPGASGGEHGTKSTTSDANLEQISPNYQYPTAAIHDPPSTIVSPSSPSPKPPAPSLLLSVTDTGIGIKSQDQERIFERFYRVDKARSRELGGTGLGLAIVKHLAQALGGAVTVQSVPGQGSTFTVRLLLA